MEKTRIKINGDPREVDSGLMLAELLATLEVNPKGIAVEVNKEVVPKSLHHKTAIKDGDTIEIIRMTGGG